MSANIVIVDYGMANLRSVQKAFEQAGHAAEITADPDRVASAKKVVLPGVGAFRDAIVRLRETHLATAITDQIQRGRPFLERRAWAPCPQRFLHEGAHDVARAVGGVFPPRRKAWSVSSSSGDAGSFRPARAPFTWPRTETSDRWGRGRPRSRRKAPMSERR